MVCTRSDYITIMNRVPPADYMPTAFTILEMLHELKRKGKT
jgi:hypothetical protein